MSNSTVSPGNLELSFMYVQWSQSLALFPMIEAGQLIALQALLAFGQHLRHRVALKRLAQDHRNALANLRQCYGRRPFFPPLRLPHQEPCGQ